jgi:MFS family permease
MASLSVTLITLSKTPASYWRIPFWAGAITAILGLYMRLGVKPHPRSQNYFQKFEVSSLHLLWKERLGIIRIALITNISWLTYTVPFVFLNTFIPLINQISLSEMMALNTLFLGADMVLIPFFGEFIKKFPIKKVMMGSGLVLSLSILPLFYFLNQASLGYVTFVRSWIVVWGLVYLCPLNVLYLDQFKGNKKYLLIGMGNALSAATIGRLTPAICLFLWHQTGWIWAPALYMFLFFILGVIAVKWALTSHR